MKRVEKIWFLVVLGVVFEFVPARAEERRVLHLDDAMSTAVVHQPAILQARAQTEAAAGVIDQARSGYLPQVTGNALVERVHGQPTSGTTAVGGPTGTTHDIFSVGVNATQLIWDFGQTIDRTRSAAASRDAQQAAERTAKFQVALQVRQAFFQAHAEKALVRVGEQTVANEERHLAQIQAFVREEIRPEIDLAQARTDLANAQVTLINARTGYATAKSQLNEAMGVFGSIDYDVADDDMGPVPGEDQSAESLVRSALENRPEMAGLLKQRRAEELTLSSIHGAYGPTLSAFGGVSEGGLALDALGTNWNVGLNLIWPLFQGGLTTGQARSARGNIDATNAQVAQEELSVRVQLEQALLAIASAKVVIGAARDAVENSSEQLRLAEGRYEAGVGSIIELGDAQVTWASTGAQLVQAEYSLASARANLLTALGK